MMEFSRRILLAGVASLAATVATGAISARLETLKIGFQKTNLPVIAQQPQHNIETLLAPLGTKVEWVEFTAGPPLVVTLNVGAIHFGWTGDAPPNFGQSAGAAISYVVALPANGRGEAIITHADKGIEKLADLKGKKHGEVAA